MQTLSFTSYTEVEFDEPISKGALALGDVDSDGRNELVLGSQLGHLQVFKHGFSKPAYTAGGLGLTSLVEVFDIYGSGDKHILCVSAEGVLTIFEVPKSTSNSPCRTRDLKEVYTQLIPASPWTWLVQDIDGDGHVEIVLSCTDKKVYIFRWYNEPQSSCLDLREAACVTSYLPSQFSKNSTCPIVETAPAEPLLTAHLFRPTGFLVYLQVYQLPAFVNSVALLRNANLTQLIVSQPGGEAKELFSLDGDTPIHFDLAVQDSRGTVLSSELRPGHSMLHTEADVLSFGAPRSNCLAVCTGDGRLNLTSFTSTSVRTWSHRNRTQSTGWAAGGTVDINGDGETEAVFCASNGDTLICDTQENFVLFSFGRTVQAFVTGLFGSPSASLNTCCLVYAPTCQRVTIFYDVFIDQMHPVSLRWSLLEHWRSDPDLVVLAERVDAVTDEAEKMTLLRNIIKWVYRLEPNFPLV